MIISDKLKLVFQPVERTGSQTIEALLKIADPEIRWLGNFRHERVAVPEGYDLLISKRDPLERLISWWSKANTVDYMTSPVWYNFESFMRFISFHKDRPFLHDINASLYSPHNKQFENLLVRFPIPQSYYWEGAVAPKYVVNYATFLGDVRSLPFVDAQGNIPVVDASDASMHGIRI